MTGRRAPCKARAVLGGLAVVLLATAGGAEARPSAMHFERIGKVGGPPPAVILSLLVDRNGLMWIGSRHGLLLFDGYTYTTFQADATDPGAITDNTIRTLYEDTDGTLWVGTNTGGLNRFDPRTRSFTHYRHDSADPRSLSHDSVYAVHRDRQGNLWVGTQTGLNRLAPGADDFDRIFAGGPEGLVEDYILTMYEDRAGRLWVGTLGGGLHRWDETLGRFEVYRNDPDDPRSLCEDRIFALHEDERGGLWVGTMQGLCRLDPHSGTFVTAPMQPDDPEGLPSAPITALAQGAPGKLWVATHSGGLVEMDTSTFRIRTFQHEPGRIGSLSEDRIIGLLAEPDETLWIGTWGGGLVRLSGAARLVEGPGNVSLPLHGESTHDVTSVFADRAGRFWLGTRSGFVLRVDPDTGAHDTVLVGGVAGIARQMLDIAEDGRGQMWVASNWGLLRLDSDLRETLHLIHEADDPTGLGPGYVTVVRPCREGGVWVGTGEGGVHLLDWDGRVVRRFTHHPDDPNSLSDNYVTALLEDRDGALWVGTRSGGLNELDPVTGSARRFQPVANDRSSLGHHYVSSLLQDERGRIWVGTAGGGLNRVDRAPNGAVRFARITESDGLADDDVTGILEEDDGSLWVTTRGGLSRYQPERGAFANLFVSDGLPSIEFEAHATARNSRWLCFGSVSGHVVIPAGTPFHAPEPSPVVVRSVRNAQGELPGTAAKLTPDRVAVRYGSWLSVEAAVLDYTPELEHRYAFRIADEWVDIGSRREITFSALPPGTHLLRIRGRNSQGVWNEIATPLEVTVVPPFWMTVPFRVLAVAAFVGLAVAVHRARTAVLARRNSQLVELHRERDKVSQDLDEAYQRLRRLTIRLEAAKEDERQRIARELHDEMGPSLTAVIINLQLAAIQKDPAKANRKVEDSVELVDRMIQRIRDLSLDLRPPFLDELGLVAALSGYLEGVSERTGIEIRVHTDGNIEPLPAHIPIAAFRVVQEAVTNAVRHSHAARIDVSIRRQGPRLDLSVEDDGRGFDVRETLDRAVSGRSVGLLGMRERVSMLYGEIEIDSTPGAGTRIRARLPLSEAA